MTDDGRCHVRIMCSFLPEDIECVREKHASGAHVTRNGGVFHVKETPKPPLLKKRSIKIRRKK